MIKTAVARSAMEFYVMFDGIIYPEWSGLEYSRPVILRTALLGSLV